MAAKRGISWKPILVLLLAVFLLEGGVWIFTPNIANMLGMAWQGGLPDHIMYAGMRYDQPTACLSQAQIDQNSLIQVGQVPTLFGDPLPLFVIKSQHNGKGPDKETYLQTVAGCYVGYQLHAGP